MESLEGHVSNQLFGVLLMYATKLGISLPTGPEEPKQAGRYGLGTESFIRAFDRVQKNSGDDFFGLHLAESMLPGYGRSMILMSVMANCPTLGNALEKLALYHGVTTDIVSLRIGRRGGLMALTWDAAPRARARLGRHYMEAAMGSCALMLRNLAADAAIFTEVRFRHAGLSQTGEYRRIFGCRVEFCEEADALLLSPESLRLPIRLSDPELLETLERYLRDVFGRQTDAGTCSGRALRYIRGEILRGGNPSLISTAAELAASSRTLQQRLLNERTSFRKLVEEARKEIALADLQQNSASVGEIAFHLGFSEQSAFTRAFRRWTGASPREYRKTIQVTKS